MPRIISFVSTYFIVLGWDAVFEVMSWAQQEVILFLCPLLGFSNHTSHALKTGKMQEHKFCTHFRRLDFKFLPSCWPPMIKAQQVLLLMVSRTWLQFKQVGQLHEQHCNVITGNLCFTGNFVYRPPFTKCRLRSLGTHQAVDCFESRRGKKQGNLLIVPFIRLHKRKVCQNN